MSQKDVKLFEELSSKLRATVRDRGLKNTIQREVILKALINTKGHLTSDEILSAVVKTPEGKNIGKATIYRTLNFFEQEGFVSSISFGIDGKKYELQIKEHHDHMICDVCDEIIEFVSEEIEKIQLQIAEQNGFEIKWHAMQLHGLCRECNEKLKGKK